MGFVSLPLWSSISEVNRSFLLVKYCWNIVVCATSTLTDLPSVGVILGAVGCPVTRYVTYVKCSFISSLCWPCWYLIRSRPKVVRRQEPMHTRHLGLQCGRPPPLYASGFQPASGTCGAVGQWPIRVLLADS